MGSIGLVVKTVNHKGHQGHKGWEGRINLKFHGITRGYNSTYVLISQDLNENWTCRLQPGKFSDIDRLRFTQLLRHSWRGVDLFYSPTQSFDLLV